MYSWFSKKPVPATVISSPPRAPWSNVALRLNQEWEVGMGVGGVVGFAVIFIVGLSVGAAA
jgi:hypothetical protein